MTLLIPFTILGCALGVTLLVNLPREALMLGIGVFTLFYAAYQLYDPVNIRPISRVWAAPAGFVGGMMGTMFGAGAPPYVMYLTRRVAEKAALRSTIAAMAVLSIGARFLAFAGAGLMFNGELWMVCVLLAPAAGLGLYCGHRMHLRISRQQMLRAIFVMLLVSGGSLLARALSQSVPYGRAWLPSIITLLSTPFSRPLCIKPQSPPYSMSSTTQRPLLRTRCILSTHCALLPPLP